MKGSISWFVLCVAAALASCDSATSPGELYDVQGNWQLQSFALSGGTTVPVPDPGSYTVRFNADESVDIQADCNRCMGSYETDGRSLSFGPLACTRAFCGDDSLDSQYIAALETSSSFVRTGEGLNLNYSQGTMRFRTSAQ